MRVEVNRGSRHAVVQCSACRLKGGFDVSPADQIVDIYCKFTDNFYSGGTETSRKTVEVVESTSGSVAGTPKAGDDEEIQADTGSDTLGHEEEECFDPPSGDEESNVETDDEEAGDTEEPGI